ncbi:lamin tail domain-containing protein [Streptomyces triculaminicus]|uniref:lamin tail domain-containing protein n=1 Tax=Streptomyces triculaminicus TaxID=2816232 RepID=UPI0037875B25
MSRLIAHLAVAAATAGALASAVLPASAASAVASFGAIQYDSPGKDTRSNSSLNAEWVTVTNRTNRTLDLNGWTLSDADRHTYRFHLKLGAGRSVKVHTGTGRDTASDVYWGSKAYVWNNDRDTATLKDAKGRTLATKSWR